MDVILLSQEECKLCEQAKSVLERLAGEYPLTLSMLDLSSDEGRAMADSGGVLFPPGVFLDGEPFSYGRLSERKLRRELDRKFQA